MFSLDRSKNDTSVMLDFLRALAAQVVCVGHALNLANGTTITKAPDVGVLLFFLLSGFVIAYTLSTKSEADSYGLVSFGIERFSRIYSAFFPAIILIAAADYLMQYLGHPLPGDPTNLRTLFGNLTMRQGLPSDWGVSTFGSAGQLTSVAVEFHIYFFVGAIFFLLKGRNVLLCAIVAVLFSTMPFGYFLNIPGSDRSLFAMWLAGFAAYYVVRSIKLDGSQAIFSTVAFFGLIWYWASHRTDNDYDISNYPAFTLAFLALVIFTQSVRFLPDSASRVIRFAADYSFSLFLVHFTVVKIVLMIPGAPSVKAVCSVLIANIVAIAFALAFERHYRRIANLIKNATLSAQNSVSGA
jgi:peptidoglycan/LPS O-acetylase OafA/YrhL